MTLTHVQDLDTPALLVHRSRLEGNIAGMQRVADQAGVRLRPHIKTHKSKEIAKLQLAAGAKGLTCAKLSEAEAMSEVCDDLLVAYPIVGEAKFDRLEALSGRVRTRVSVESLEAAQALNSHLARSGRTQEALVKVESGLARTGVEAGELRGFLEQVLRLDRIRVVGLFTHEGIAYRCSGRTEIAGLLAGIAGRLAGMRETFRQVVGIEPEVSPGCSLTAKALTTSHGFTEIRPGTYVFADTFCVESEVFAEEECALAVLVRVIAVKGDGRVVVDGGSKTFAMDRHPRRGHGMVVGHPEIFFDRLSEEHGVLLTKTPERHRVGDLLEIIPAHVCPAVNLHDSLFLREGEEVLDEWRIDARGCVR